MPPVPLAVLVKYCDQLLRTAEIKDWDGACNGLQVENRREVSRIAAAVDGSLATVRLAVEAKADLLLVHHGLFWGATHPWTGARYGLMRLLLEKNVAVYSSHLPLDLHPKLGNNAQLCAALGFKRLKPFFLEKGQFIGLKTRVRIARAQLVRNVSELLQVAPRVLPGGKPDCERIGVVTGGAGDELARAAEEGIDTFITGEGRHWTYALAEELGLNVIYGGHYATETFGVKALAAHLAERFRLSWVFLDHPTGL